MKYAMILAAVLGLIVIGTSSSYADTTTSGSDPIFMKVAGITGDTQTKEFSGDIELNSFQLGIEHPIDIATGQSSGKTIFSPIAITKIMDSSSPALFSKVASGQSISQIDIFFAKTTPSGLQTYAHYILKNVIISSYSVSSGGDTPSESIILSFETIQFEFSTTNADGTLNPPSPTVGWDIATNTLQ